MKFALALVICAAALSAQEKKGPLVGSSQGMFAIAKNDVMKSIDKIPEDLWSYRPTKDVRTVGELFAHIADGQYEFCGAADGGGAVPDPDLGTVQAPALLDHRHLPLDRGAEADPGQDRHGGTGCHRA